MPTVRRSLEEIAANRPVVDRAKIAATTDEDIDQQIADDDDTAPDVTTLGAPRIVKGDEPIDVAAIRNRLSMTQEQFAAAFDLDVWTVRQWEQRRRTPERPARVLLRVIDRNPDAVRRALAEN